MPGQYSTVVRFSGFELSPAYRRLSNAAGEIALRAKSFDVLLYLVGAAGRVVSKTELLDAVWPDVTVSDESLERCVSDIRAALSDVDRSILKTVARRGYIFAAPVEHIEASTSDSQAIKWKIPAFIAICALAIVLSFLGLNRTHELTRLVAVLPIVNASGHIEQDYFVDGLTEDLTLALAQFKSINVVATSSASKFKNSALSPKEIGEKLGAAFLLNGNLRQSPDKIVLSLQLVNSASGAQLWSGQYDGAPEGFVGAKSDLIGTIASALDAHITKAELDRIALKSPSSLDAYDLVLQGNALIRNTHVEKRGQSISDARARYEAAVAIAPRSADAAEGLANSYLMAWLEPSPGHPTNDEFQAPNSLKWAGDYARHAVELDETSASARATLGWVLYWQSGPAEALPSFDRAIELNPGLADWRYGLLLSHGGRANDAEIYMKRIMQIDPLYPPRYKYLLGKAYFFQGKYDSALPLIRQAAVEMPSHRPSHVLLAAVAGELGLKSELSKDVDDILKLDPKFTISGWLNYIRISDKDYAARLVRGLETAGLAQ